MGKHVYGTVDADVRMHLFGDVHGWMHDERTHQDMYGCMRKSAGIARIREHEGACIRECNAYKRKYGGNMYARVQCV